MSTNLPVPSFSTAWTSASTSATEKGLLMRRWTISERLDLRSGTTDNASTFICGTGTKAPELAVGLYREGASAGGWTESWSLSGQFAAEFSRACGVASDPPRYGAGFAGAILPQEKKNGKYRTFNKSSDNYPQIDIKWGNAVQLPLWNNRNSFTKIKATTQLNWFLTQVEFKHASQLTQTGFPNMMQHFQEMQIPQFFFFKIRVRRQPVIYGNSPFPNAKGYLDSHDE